MSGIFSRFSWVSGSPLLGVSEIGVPGITWKGHNLIGNMLISSTGTRGSLVSDNLVSVVTTADNSFSWVVHGRFMGLFIINHPFHVLIYGMLDSSLM